MTAVAAPPGFIPLHRVHLRQSVNMPGETPPGKPPRYPRSDDVLLSVDIPVEARLVTRERYHLWLDTRYGQIVIEHPRSHERECVPMHMVKQLRFADGAGAKSAAHVKGAA